MTSDPDHRRFQRLNTPSKLNTGLRTALNNLIGASQRKNVDSAEFEVRMAWAKRLLDAGADPTQATSPSGLTLLHWAVRMDCTDMARLLISYGADPQQKDTQINPKSALDYSRTTVERSRGWGQSMLTLLLVEAPILMEQRTLGLVAHEVSADPSLNNHRPRL